MHVDDSVGALFSTCCSNLLDTTGALCPILEDSEEIMVLDRVPRRGFLAAWLMSKGQDRRRVLRFESLLDTGYKTVYPVFPCSPQERTANSD